MKVYYAHPLSLYSTPQEARDLALLRALGYEVVNPNHPDFQAGYLKSGMEYFRQAIQSCGMVMFRAFPDGSIPAGIAKEIGYGIEFGCVILELPSCIARRTLSVDVTRAYLSETGFR